jgi:hypothetical protein
MALHKNSRSGGEDDDEDDDEFFGNQDDSSSYHDDETYGEHGAGRSGLALHESRAREEELKTIGYLDSYDANKEVMLQEGFEQGYRETYHVAIRIGMLLGQASALGSSILVAPTSTNHISDPVTADMTKEGGQLHPQILLHQPQDRHDRSERVIQRVHEFLTSFETKKNIPLEALRVPNEMEHLEHELKTILQMRTTD